MRLEQLTLGARFRLGSRAGTLLELFEGSALVQFDGRQERAFTAKVYDVEHGEQARAVRFSRREKPVRIARAAEVEPLEPATGQGAP